MDKKNLGTISLLSIVLAISLLLAGCSSLMYYINPFHRNNATRQYEQIKLDVDSATSIDDFTKLAMDAYHLFETYPELSYSVIQASINSRLLNLDIPYQCESTGELYLNFVPTQQQVVSKTIDSQDITILISWYDTYRSESIRCEIDIPASICQVFNSIVQNVTEIAISEQDITVLISWGEPYLKEIQEIYGEQSSHIVQETLQRTIETIENNIVSTAISEQDITILTSWVELYLKEIQEIYGEQSSDIVHDMIQQTIGAIENSVVSDAVAAEDPKLISDYFLKGTCKELVDYELCSEQDMKQLAQTLIAQKIEQQVYDKAVREENPSIYTDAYPNGSFDATHIPVAGYLADYENALLSLDNARKYLLTYSERYISSKNGFTIYRKEMGYYFALDTGLQLFPQKSFDVSVSNYYEKERIEQWHASKNYRILKNLTGFLSEEILASNVYVQSNGIDVRITDSTFRDIIEYPSMVFNEDSEIDVVDKGYGVVELTISKEIVSGSLYWQTYRCKLTFLEGRINRLYLEIALLDETWLLPSDSSKLFQVLITPVTKRTGYAIYNRDKVKDGDAGDIDVYLYY